MRRLIALYRRNAAAVDAHRGAGAASFDGLCTAASLVIVGIELALFAVMVGDLP